MRRSALPPLPAAAPAALFASASVLAFFFAAAAAARRCTACVGILLLTRLQAERRKSAPAFAVSILSARPWNSSHSGTVTARCASSGDATKPKPRDCLVLRSRTTKAADGTDLAKMLLQRLVGRVIRQIAHEARRVVLGRCRRSLVVHREEGVAKRRHPSDDPSTLLHTHRRFPNLALFYTQAGLRPVWDSQCRARSHFSFSIHGRQRKSNHRVSVASSCNPRRPLETHSPHETREARPPLTDYKK